MRVELEFFSNRVKKKKRKYLKRPILLPHNAFIIQLQQGRDSERDYLVKRKRPSD